jgi:hypothetical protein
MVNTTVSVVASSFAGQQSFVRHAWTSLSPGTNTIHSHTRNGWSASGRHGTAITGQYRTIAGTHDVNTQFGNDALYIWTGASTVPPEASNEDGVFVSGGANNGRLQHVFIDHHNLLQLSPGPVLVGSGTVVPKGTSYFN